MIVSAIVLAAGRSTRFGGVGQHKLLAPWNGVPLVRLSVAAAVDAAVGEVIVVTGAETRRVEQAIAGLDVRVVHERAFGDGIATSLRCGLRALSPDTRAVAVALGDQPLVRPAAYRRLVDTWISTNARIVVPRYADHMGPAHPVLFAAEVMDELLTLTGDSGARHVVARDPARVAIARLDWGAPLDVDTQDDLARLASERRPRG